MAASWECPALPMLSLPIKESGKSSYLGIKPMISAHYEENPDSFHEEIKQLDQLRENSMHPSRDYNGISVLRRYFAQLHLLRARFPPETIGQLPIDFAWKDIFSGAEYIQEGLQIEQASVLYNISALHSILGCRSKRDLEQEIKESITHFQCAAGAFNYLDEQLAVNHASKDISPPFISFYKNLMLGQAQECFVEKSLRGSARVKSVTIAKLSTRVADYYVETSRCLETEPCSIIAKKNKDWAKLLKVKMLYFQAVAHFYQGAACEESGQLGTAIAWNQMALKKLNSIGRVPKSVGEGLREGIKNFIDHIQAKVVAGRKQNDQVYHDRIPDLETLEPYPGIDLVKPVVFSPTDSKNLGADIFSRLVPMRAYEASSLYSERKDELMRSINSSVSEKDEELEQFLKTLNVGEIEKLNEGPPEIPADVLEQHKQLQGKSMLVKKLHSDLQELIGFSDSVTKDLSDMEQRRMEDDQEEEKFQAQFGARPTSQVCASMWKDLDNYKTYHDQGSKSNTELKAMFDQHYRYLVLLSGPLTSLQAAVPRMTPMDAPEEDARDSDRWKELLGKVREMQQQRTMLVGQLRGQIKSDDITKNLVCHLGTDAEGFIEEQMKKHKELADIVRKNLAAQDNILSAVVDANARKVKVRQVAQDLTEQQESMFSALTKAGKFFTVLQGKITEGLGFYSRVNDNVSKLRNRVFDVTSTRSRERENMERQKSGTPTPPPPPTQPSSSAPPPRPPKKAELAGNPIVSSQSGDTTHTVSSPPPNQTSSHNPLNLKSPDTESQALPSHTTIISTEVGESPNMIAAVPTQGDPQGSDFTMPPAQSLEEQLKELQKQQQLQLQSLGQMNVTASLPPPGTSQPFSVIGTMDTPPPSTSHVPVPDVPDPSHPSLSPHASPIRATTDRFSSLNISNSSQLVMGELNSPLSQDPTEHTDGSQNSMEANQALLNLQLLLQPPAEDLSSLTTPLQPELTIPPVQAESDVAVSQISDLNMGMEHTQISIPAHIQSLNMQPVVSPPSGPPSMENPTPYVPTPPPSQQQAFTLKGETGQTSGSEQGATSDADLSKNTLLVGINEQSPIPPQPASSSSEYYPNQAPQMQDLPAIPVQPVPNALGNADNTMTINSISRPIPAPIMSPPTTPNQNLELNQDQTGEMEQDADSSAQSDLVSSGQQSLNESGQSTGIRAMGSVETSWRDIKTPDAVSENQDETSSQTDLESTLEPSLAAGQIQSSMSIDLTSATLQNLANITPVVPAPISIPGMELSHGLNTELHSLQLSDTSFNPIPGIGSTSLGSTSLHMPPSISPLAIDVGTHLPQMNNPVEHLQSLVNRNRTLQSTIDEKNREIEQHRANSADQKSQLENYKQQLFILQQQLGNVSLQQQKQEQEKATASGQQAVLMQLLQQQQGMFSQQQAQIEKLSKASDSFRKDQMDMEIKYKQMLAVEQEKNANLTSQNLQLTQEINSLKQQIQSNAQQQQMVQVHLYQYQTQIQERDKQLLAFRDQHKQIIQSLEQKYQQKVAQLVQQIQELQTEMKKSKVQRQRTPVSMSPMSARTTPQMQAQQFSQPLQQQVPQQPGTPISAHHPQQKALATPTSATPQMGSPRPPNPPQAQPPLQPQAFQSLQQQQQQQQQQGLPPRSLPNPMPPQPQLPTPLIPQPAPGTMAPPQLDRQTSGVAPANQWSVTNQPTAGNPGAMNQGGQQQQFHSGPSQQPRPLQQQQQQQLTSQSGHMIQGTLPRQGMGAQGQGHHTQIQGQPQSGGGQTLPHSSQQMLPPHQSTLQVSSSTPMATHPQQPQQLGGQGVIGQGGTSAMGGTLQQQQQQQLQNPQQLGDQQGKNPVMNAQIPQQIHDMGTGPAPAQVGGMPPTQFPQGVQQPLQSLQIPPGQFMGTGPGGAQPHSFSRGPPVQQQQQQGHQQLPHPQVPHPQGHPPSQSYQQQPRH